MAEITAYLGLTVETRICSFCEAALEPGLIGFTPQLDPLCPDCLQKRDGVLAGLQQLVYDAASLVPAMLRGELPDPS